MTTHAAQPDIVKPPDAQPATILSVVPLAIIGIGCLFPKAEDPATYWANIREGIDAITDIPATHWKVGDYFDQDQKSPDHTYGRRGGFISPVPFNPLEFNIPPNILEAIDTSQLLGLVAAGQALRDAGYGPEREYDRSRASVILGVTGAMELVIPLGARLGHPLWRAALKEAGVADTVADDVVARISDSYVDWQENSFPGLLGNVVAGRISKQYDLGGTNCVVDAACASSFSALHLAGMELATGKADMVVTGGIDTFNDIFMYMCFSKTPALSPTGDAKPFDAAADGTILGEGLGIMVIKRLADAERDGDRIYAVIRGIGSSSDGRGDAIYAPSAGGQKKALYDAYDRAGVTPESIGLIEAHGTGTRVGDAVEVKALREVYGQARTPWCALGSVKAQIGHTKAAAGAAGLIKTALALHHKVIPPTIKVSNPLGEITGEQTPFYLTTEKRPWLPSGTTPRRAAVSAFGFGGSNFHTVLEEYCPAKSSADWDGNVQIIPFSGASVVELEQSLKAFTADLPWKELRDRALTARRGFDAGAPCRLVLVVERDRKNLATLVANAGTMLRSNGTSSWQTPDGAFFASGGPTGKLAFLFPGQGTQYTGMLRDLACTFPELFTALAQADAGYGLADGIRLSDRIYPPTAFSPQGKERLEEELRATHVAQPAIGAVSLGALRLLDSFGLIPDAAAGHSYGELTALCAAGKLDEATFHHLSRLRGRLMAAGDGDRGGMVAVPAPLALVEQALAEEGLELVVANRNAPSQAVLSGSSAEIERAIVLFGARRLACKRLPVAAAFHSPLVADAALPFREALADVTFGATRLPVFANSTAAPYPDDDEAAKSLLAGQLARPVEFVAEIEALHASGISTFVEVGPGARLTGLVKAILGERNHLALALDASAGKRSGMADLARLLGHLAVLGYPIRLNLWDAGHQPAAPATGKKPVMTIPICGANYLKPKKKREALDAGRLTSGTTNLEPRTSRLEPGTSTFEPSASRLEPGAGILAESLRVTRESMAVLQKMQEDTAQLHRRFLEGQEAAGRTIQGLLDQQNRLLHGGSPFSAAVAAPSLLLRGSAPPSLPAVVPPAASPPTPVVPVPRVSVAVTSNVTVVLLEVVSEKTGYPAEMLELEMGLDSDLGIDSIKRVEILSALQERLPSAPVIGPEQMGSLRTLADIARFLGSDAAASENRTDRSDQSDTSDRITGTLLSVVSEKTGYPVEMLELEMGLDSDLGIDSIKRVEILSALQERLPSAPVIGPEQMGSLRTLADIARFLGSDAASSENRTDRPDQSDTSDSITGTLLSVVSEKTGYPVEMLELEMGLDSDLGIDSIKRVEILSALQERLPGAPVIGPGQMGNLRTLGDIVVFLGSEATSREHRSNSSDPSDSPVRITNTLLTVVSEKTGYPVEMLELEMGLDSDLGIDSIKRVEILSALQERLPGAPVIGPEQMGNLRTLGDIVAFLGNGVACIGATHSSPRQNIPEIPPVEIQPDPTGTVDRSAVIPLPLDPSLLALATAGSGEFWVTDDGSPFATELVKLIRARGQAVRLVDPAIAEESAAAANISGLVIITPHAGADELFLEDAFLLLKSAASPLCRAAAAGGAIFTTVSRLDGSFGFGVGTSLTDPLSGGLAGLAKCAAREWPEVACKAIDLGGFLSGALEADAVVGELFTPGPVEVGLTPAGRIALKISSLPASPRSATAPVQAGEVIIVTGGGRGVTAAAAVALATAYRPLLVLLGRSPEPAAEPAWLAPLTDDSPIKRAILDHAGEKLSPREIETRYQAVLAGRELRATLARIQATGGQALYRSLDIRDAGAVAELLAVIRRDHGPIRGIVHGAGVLADRLIVDKSRDQFAAVLSTKVSGLRNLLAETHGDDLRFIALFSSTTGRFGRSGQVDYAVANEVLNKLAQAEARRRPDCRTVSINWGPWDGGMVTPALKKLFAGEGIGLIGLAEGGDFLVRELAAVDAPVEVVALAEGGDGSETLSDPVSSQPLSEALTLTLTLEEYPFLRSHIMDGRLVVPMAVIVEWLAHGALHGNPGFRFHGFNELRICKGIVFDRQTPCTLRIMAGRAARRESFHLVPVELRGISSAGSILHARAEIILATRLPEGIRSIGDLPATHYVPFHGEIYHRERLFHGPDLQGIQQVLNCSPKGITALVKGAPKPAAWITRPLRSDWLTDPLVMDSAFQMMILWSFERFSAGSLPTFAARYRQFTDSFPRDGVQVVIRVTSEREQGATADMEFLDRQTGKLVARLNGYECVIDPSLQRAFLHNQLPRLGAA